MIWRQAILHELHIEAMVWFGLNCHIGQQRQNISWSHKRWDTLLGQCVVHLLEYFDSNYGNKLCKLYVNNA